MSEMPGQLNTDGEEVPPEITLFGVTVTQLIEDHKAKRYNTGKPQLSYVLDVHKTLEALARVFEQGAIKYERDNWKKGGKPDAEYFDSALRHIKDAKKGEWYDDDIGTMHIANAIWNLAALIDLNHADKPNMDPNFDQEAFIKKYQGES